MGEPNGSSRRGRLKKRGGEKVLCNNNIEIIVF
jgi:hypothetical protein